MLRYQGTARAAVLGDGVAILFDDRCLGDVLVWPIWRREAEELLAETGNSPDNVMAEGAWAFTPLVTRPDKIVCVGPNYTAHIGEMGRGRPEVPTLFTRLTDAAVGAKDDIRMPKAYAEKLNYEGELAVIVGETCLRMSGERVQGAIAGYAIMNDLTQRDFQYAITQWLQGKTLQHASASGPWMFTTDAFNANFARVRTYVDRELHQGVLTTDLVFSPAKLIAYISQLMQLNPSDVISTGTPTDVGRGMSPRTYLQDGQEIVIIIDGLGEQANTIRINH